MSDLDIYLSIWGIDVGLPLLYNRITIKNIFERIFIMKQVTPGIYPTMITPYKNGKIDEKGVRALVNWYIDHGCEGIFAVCQSSEMMFLTLKERVELAKTVVDEAAGRITIVASGHCSESIEAQAEEMDAISETGVDAFVWVTNRLDLHNDGDEVWLENAEKLLSLANKDIPLGAYECPMPYKRLLTPRILDWCVSTGRFKFIKDTCCDPVELTRRAKQLEGTGFILFNANEQTFLHSLKAGEAGYSGIMANFHPDLLRWLLDNYEKEPERAEALSDILSMTAFTESPAYNCTAKHYLNTYEGLDITLESRSCDHKRLTPYQKLAMEQLYRVNKRLYGEYCK